MTLLTRSLDILTLNMAFRKYRDMFTFLLATTSGGMATFYGIKYFEDGQRKEHTNGNGGYMWNSGQSAIWQRNWDCREPKPALYMRNEGGKIQEDQESNALRHIVLVRHGEYLNFTDGSHHLTERGRLQSQLTGQRLRAMSIPWDHVVASTMSRAQETANIIVKELNLDPLKLKKCTLLPEGLPIPPEPPSRQWRPPEVYHRDGPRIEAAFRRYFFRASPEQREDSYLLIVGHANVIRYFVCRALQFPPEAWSRINLNHGSITWITIGPNGHVAIKYLGDTGFMPVDYITYRKPRVDQDIIHKI